MLEGLSDIDWSAWQDAYGPATAVPGYLRAIADGRGAGAALEDLQNAINHQGTVTPAIVPATPFIVALAASGCEPHAELLRFVGDIACGGDHANVALDPTELAPDPIHDVLAAILPSACAALTHARPEVRAAAAVAIAFLGGADAQAALVAAASDEKKAEVLATFLPALAVMRLRVGPIDGDEALFTRAGKGRAAALKLAGLIALAHVAPTSDHALALLKVAHDAKDTLRGVAWCDGELRALGLRLGARILSAHGDVERLLSLEDTLGPEPVWRMVLTMTLGHDVWTGPAEPYLASDLDPAQTRVIRTLAERWLARKTAAERGKAPAPPLGVFSSFGLFAIDRLMGITPAGPRDACPRRRSEVAEPLWRTAWRMMRAGVPDASWDDALGDHDADARVALALDVLDMRDGATFPPKLQRTHGETGRYVTGRNRLIAATLAGVPADRIAPHITRRDLAWTQAPLVHAWARALVAEGRAIPDDADPVLSAVLGRLDNDATIARELVEALPMVRRDRIAGALELNLIVSDDVPRGPRVPFFRIGWHVVDLVPALYAHAVTTVAGWTDVPGPSPHERAALDPIIEAGVVTRLARAPALARAHVPAALPAAKAAGARILHAVLATLAP